MLMMEREAVTGGSTVPRDCCLDNQLFLSFVVAIPDDESLTKLFCRPLPTLACIVKMRQEKFEDALSM